MKFTVHSQLLKDGINKILSVVDKKSNRQHLTNCLFEVGKEHVAISSTDLEVSALINIKAEIYETGSFCINAKNIFDIFKEMPEDIISFELADDKKLLKLCCRKINFSLLISSPEDFPALNFGLEHQHTFFKISAGEILRAISVTSHAMSNDETRLFFNGLFFQRIESNLRIVSSDGHRLTWYDISNLNPQFLESSYLSEGIIVPKKGVFEIKKLAESCQLNEELNFSIDESFIYVNNCKNYFISSRLIAREYPRYQAVVPKNTIQNINVQLESFLTAVKRIRLFASEKSNAVKLSLRENELQISANHPSLGDAKESLSIAYTGKDFDIGFNAKYLVDALSVIGDQQVSIDFGFNNELSPVVIKFPTMPKFLSIIMPLKL